MEYETKLIEKVKEFCQFEKTEMDLLLVSNEIICLLQSRIFDEQRKKTRLMDQNENKKETEKEIEEVFIIEEKSTLKEKEIKHESASFSITENKQFVKVREIKKEIQEESEEKLLSREKKRKPLHVFQIRKKENYYVKANDFQDLKTY